MPINAAERLDYVERRKRFMTAHNREREGNPPTRIPGIKLFSYEHNNRANVQKRRERHAANVRARADMNRQMSQLGPTHLRPDDNRCKEFHAFLNSMSS